MMWKALDRIGYWIATAWTPVRQVRAGVLATLGSIVLLGWLPFAGEPPLIYAMSALALLLGGLGIVVTAVLAVKEDPGSSEEDLAP